MTFVNQNFPNRAALITEGGLVVTYKELNESLYRFSRYLNKRAIIFIVGENDYPSLICYLSSLQVGAVPLLLSNGIHEAQLNSLIQVYDPQFIFYKNEHVRDSHKCKPVHQEAVYGLYVRNVASVPVLHEDLALLLATSGSTGSPKLVRLSHRNISSNAESIAQYLNISVDDRAITSLPFNYSYGLSVINSYLCAGASLVLSNRSMFDAQFWRQINEYSVTSFAGVPYNFEILLKLRFANMKIPTVRMITQAGGKLSSEKIQRVFDICCAKNIDFYSMYGQTEATARIAYLPTEDTVRKLGSIGVAIPGGRIWLEDSQGAVISQSGITGEMIYEGPNVSLGYAESLEDLKLGDVNKGVLETGDLVRFDEDGYFFIEGRKHRFLKIYGNRISLDAVESMVSEKGYSAAALGTDDNLVLHVVQMPHLCVDTLRIEMAETLSLNKAAIFVRPIAELPRLESGKINYQWLSQLT